MKKIFTFFVLMLMFPIGSVTINQKTAYLVDGESYSFEFDETTSNIDEFIQSTPIITSIQPDAVHETRIPMSEAAPYRRGSVITELNETTPGIDYKFLINVSSGVRITINNPQFIDFQQFEVSAAASVPDFTSELFYLSTLETPMPFDVFFPAQQTGDYLLSVSFFDFVDYDLTGDAISLNITIEHFQPGVAAGGERSETIQSDAYETIIETQNYLQNAGYLNFSSGQLDLKDFDPTDPGFAKGLGLAAYSLLKSAEYISEANPLQKEKIMAKYLNMAYRMYLKLNPMKVAGGEFYYDIAGSNPGNGDYLINFEDNLYALLILNEIGWLDNKVLTEPRIYSLIDDVRIPAFNLLSIMDDLFKVGPGDYRDSISITNYVSDGDNSVFTPSEYSTITYSSKSSLGLLSVLAEEYAWDNNFKEMTEIINRIIASYQKNNINGVTLEPEGIFVKDLTSSIVDIDYAFLFEQGVGTTDYSVAAKDNTPNDVPLLSATPTINDTFYFGKSVKFDSIIITGGTSSFPTLVWEYWDGAKWVNIQSQNTDPFGFPGDFVFLDDQTNNYNTINNRVLFTVPANWTSKVEFSQNAFWVRARSTAVSGPQPFAGQLKVGISTQSNTATLLDNSLLVSHLNTWTKEGYLSKNNILASSTGRTERENLEFTSSIMENTLRLFASNTDNLLYSSVDTTAIGSSEKLVTTLDNSIAIFSLNRLAVNWQIIDPSTAGDAVVRTWKIRSINGLSALSNLMRDSSTGKYFAQYDAEAKKLNSDDNDINKNQVVANLALSAPVSDAFPVTMEVISKEDLPVFSEGKLTLALSQVVTTGTWIWWDPFKPFSVNAKITIPEFGYQQELTVDLLSGFNAGQNKIVSFFYDVPKRGNYDLLIDLSVEGNILLSETITLRALGKPVTETQPADLIFSTGDTKFSPSLSIIDETGLPLASLKIEGALGNTITDSKTNFGQKYISEGRTDSSGKISLDFNVGTLLTDGIINAAEIIEAADGNIPEFIEIFMYLNITNADTFDLPVTTIQVPIRVNLARYFAEFNPLEMAFSTDENTFTSSLTIIDQKGTTVSNLKILAALGNNITTSKATFGNKYIKAGVTDTSGKVSLNYNLKDVEKDLINRNEINGSDTFLPLFINVTSPGKFNFLGEIEVGVRVTLSSVFLRISPTQLEITQGTTDSFTFTVTALNQKQEPISNAIIDYQSDEIPNIKNTVFTDNDGEATITLRDSDLFSLSNLAIINNQNTKGDLNSTVTSFTFSMIHPDYQTKVITKNLNIIPNSLKITANPVQPTVKEKNIFDTDVKSIEIEVAVEDLFSRVVNAYVRLEWANKSSEVNDLVDLSEIGIHIAPYTFNLDPSNLPAGQYTLLVIAEKEGITSTVEIKTIGGPGLSQVPVISKPVITVRTIVVESSTFQDVILTAGSLFVALLATKIGGILGYIYSKITRKKGKSSEKNGDKTDEPVKSSDPKTGDTEIDTKVSKTTDEFSVDTTVDTKAAKSSDQKTGDTEIDTKVAKTTDEFSVDITVDTKAAKSMDAYSVDTEASKNTDEFSVDATVDTKAAKSMDAYSADAESVDVSSGDSEDTSTGEYSDDTESSK